MAEELFNEAIALNDRSAAAYAGLGDVHFQRGEWGQARRFHRRAISYDSRNAEYYSKLGMDYFRLGSYQDAIRAWERTLELDQDEANAIRYIEIARSRLAE